MIVGAARIAAVPALLALASASAGASGARPPVALTASPAHLELAGTGRATVRVTNSGTNPVVLDVRRAGFALDLRGRPEDRGPARRSPHGSRLARLPTAYAFAEAGRDRGRSRSPRAAIPCYESVADFSASKRIIDACVSEYGKIDVLVNCATIAKGGQLWETSEEDSDAVFAVTLKGTLNTCTHALKAMMKQGTGRIINFASPSWLGVTGADTYTAAKGGVVSLTRGKSSTP